MGMAKKKRKRGANGLPWYRAERDCWCVPGDPRKSPIRDRYGDIVRGKGNGEKALAAWHDMQSLTHTGRAGAENLVKDVLELYLQDAHRRVSAKTFASYKSYFQSFADQWLGLTVRDLKPYHVHHWWERVHPKWGPSLRNLSGSALKAAFRWAALPGRGGAIIPGSPLDGMELPTMRKRSAEVVVTEEEFDRLLALVKSEPVRDIFVAAWETGTRPVNLTRVTKANLTPERNALLLAGHNTDPTSAVHKTFKKTGRPLVIPLPGKAREIVLRLTAKYPDGPLFRSPTGLPWSDVRLATLIRHYARRGGLAGRFTAYSCRHSRITSLLEAGMNPTDVAALAGNTPGVIHRSYSHVSANVERLLKLRAAAT